MRYFAVLIAVAALLIGAVPAQARKGRGVETPAPTAPFNPMGINFPAGGGGTTYYEGFPIFKNRVRESSGFIANGNYPVEATLSAAGWPTENFEVILWSSGNGITPSWLTGTWDCGFIGQGAELPAKVNDTLTNIVHGVSGAYTTFNLTGVGANSGFTVTNVTSTISNVYCYLPEYPGSGIDNSTSASAFTTESLTHYAHYGWIRWMQWSHPIDNSTVMTSTNRATPSNTQVSYACFNPGAGVCVEGMPQEWAAAFCVAAGTGMWLNLPNLYDGTFTYATSLATSLHALVPAGVPIYLEISDELWNQAGPGITAWQNAANASGGAPVYLAKQLHAIAAIFRGIYGSRYGTDVRLVMAWQSTGNGPFFQSQFYAYYASQGWQVGVNDGGDLYATSIAPYMNLTSPSNSWTIAQIDANLTSVGSVQAFNSYLEQNTVMGLKYGLYQIAYEGGWQTNAESSSLTNGGAAIMDGGMTTVMNNYYQTMVNSGAYGLTTFMGGVDSNDSINLSPIDELTTAYPITVANSPRYASILNFTSGWTSSRNVVTTPGATIPGGNYLDSTNGTLPNLGANGYVAPFDVPNSSVGGQVSYMECSSVQRVANLVVNFTNADVAGTTGLEYGSAPTGYAILGGAATPTSIAIPSGTNSVTVDAALPIYPGCGYVTLGTPNTRNAFITINSLTFN